MRPLLLLLILLAAGCDREPRAPAPKQRSGPVASRSAAPAEVPSRSGEEQAPSGGEDAAQALRLYYSRIEKGDYEGAWKLRTASDGIDRERFAANFKAYESYRATVGAPSIPVRSGEWEFVEVPVMITGRMRGGRPFGSSGSVSLRRSASGANRAWRIFTG